MRRIRAQLARNELDKEVSERLVDAERLVVEAVRLAEDAGRKAEDRTHQQRIRRVREDLTRLARSFDTVRTVGTAFSMEPEEKPAEVRKARTVKPTAVPPPRRSAPVRMAKQVVPEPEFEEEWPEGASD